VKIRSGGAAGSTIPGFKACLYESLNDLRFGQLAKMEFTVAASRVSCTAIDRVSRVGDGKNVTPFSVQCQRIISNDFNFGHC